jgi:hypothetical protein
VLTGADRIYKNQQLILILLDAKTVKVLIGIQHFSANSLTSALTSWPM